MLNQALPLMIVRACSHDEFRRRADECRRLAAAARNAKDRAFWLGLFERWQALESQSIRQPTPALPAGGGGKARVARHTEGSPSRRRRVVSIDVSPPLQRMAPAVGGNAAGARSRSAKRNEPF